MSLRKIRNVILFVIYTYLIANSFLFATGIVFFDELTPEIIRQGIIQIFCQWDLFNLFSRLDRFWPEILFILVPLLVYILIFAWPVSLWWRKRTVFRAWLVAVAGSFMPINIIFCIQRDPVYVIYAMLVMTSGYIVVWIVLRNMRQYQEEMEDKSFDQKLARCGNLK